MRRNPYQFNQAGTTYIRDRSVFDNSNQVTPHNFAAARNVSTLKDNPRKPALLTRSNNNSNYQKQQSYLVGVKPV